MHNLRLIIMCGISGSGKSSYIKETLTPLKYTDYSANHYFYDDKGHFLFDPKLLGPAYAACLRSFVAATIRHEERIVVDNTCTTVAEIAPYYAVGIAHGYKVQIQYIRCMDAELAHGRNKHGVPLDAIQTQLERIERLKERLPSWWNFVALENIDGAFVKVNS